MKAILKKMEACDDNIDSKSKESGENMKRKIYQIVGLALLSAALWTPMASAQVVTATGQGTDEQAAIRDASRNAVEQVVGTLVDAKTIVSGGAVDLDQIYTKSQGFVKDVQVLEKSQAGGVVTVRASIDVDTRPRAELMNNLQMLLKLNDPRIAVIVLKQDADGNVTGHDLTAEGAMNQRLLDLGFTHVVDAGIVSGLQNAQLLNQVYNGTARIGALGSSLGADYVVIGRSRTSAKAISLPDGNGGYTPTQLKTGDAVLNVRVVRFDTGEILGTFTEDAKGVENSEQMAMEKAVQKASANAAQQLEEKFRHISAQTDTSVEMDVFTSDSAAVQQLMQDLRALPAVQNVYLREQGNGKAVLSVETTESPSGLVERLKSSSKLGMYVAGMTGSTVKLSVLR